MFLEPEDTIIGKNPVNVGMQMEAMSELFESFRDLMKTVEKGEGTLGKLMTDDSLYDDLSVIFNRMRKGEGSFGKLLTDDRLYDDLQTVFGRLKDGEGTVGRLLTEDKIYRDLEAFVADIKAHPWKLLSKPRSSDRKVRKK